MNLTWDDISKKEVGAILYEEHDEGLYFIILRGPVSLCAYLGIPTTHPLARHRCDDLPVECHGGLIFSGEGNGKYLPKNFWWYGWDYAHCYDYCFYYDDDYLPRDGHKWLVDEIVGDSWLAKDAFRKLMRLAESIFTKARIKEDK